MLKQVQQIGHGTLQIMAAIGRAAILLWQTLWQMPQIAIEAKLFYRQLFFIGFYSLIIIVVSGVFIGMVLALQGYTVLVRFGADEALGQLVSLALIRELGPVVSALLFAGRAGAAITAEIGLMKATEQLSAMEMIGVDPLNRIVRPRLLAGIFCMPLLSQIFNTVAIIGAVVISVNWFAVDAASLWANMQSVVEFREDVINGIIKSLVFGFAVAWIAVFQGYDCMPTSEGISVATTRTVVYSSLAILGLDFILTLIMFGV